MDDRGATPAGQPTGPLSGVRVLDMTIAFAGPLCTLMLAALGAEVIKVEPPGGDDLARWNPPYVGPSGIHLNEPTDGDVSISMINRNRGKRSVTLNLRTERGRQLMRELAARSQVLVQNRSAGAVERLGMDYESLRKLNAALVYCSIEGVGADSEFSDVRIMDILIQALSGIMDVTGQADGPPTRVGIPVGDMCGAVFAVSGILAALRVAEKTGMGQEVRVSLVDALASLIAMEHFDALITAGVPVRSGNSHTRLTPFGVYPCQDGHIAIVAFKDEWFASLARVMDNPSLTEDHRFRGRPDRVANAAQLDAIITAWTLAHTVGEAIGKLHGDAAVPAVPVRTVADVLADPALRRSGAIAPLAHPVLGAEIPMTGSGVPWQFSASAARLPCMLPGLGDDTDSVLQKVLGVSADEIRSLRGQRVI